ncbi:hypothetical protein CDAR_308661 [Caerostris darwini]|uniref:Uncharacterized protein n=1 Tax=Caerostris darwini TaxID=1538125 RepID=A0AAV4NX83_9ARAC|nr:hypothetical protein CDAR_308661 [Caerostris darwini]
MTWASAPFPEHSPFSSFLIAGFFSQVARSQKFKWCLLHMTLWGALEKPNVRWSSTRLLLDRGQRVQHTFPDLEFLSFSPPCLSLSKHFRPQWSARPINLESPSH